MRVCEFVWGASISIHALLAESDVGDVWACRWPDISIHALLAESDSTALDQYLKEQISIHALLAESDEFLKALYMILSLFLSTLSLRRATSFRVFYWLKVTISIHALLAESDLVDNVYFL